MFCKNCGEKLKKSILFCKNCGQGVSTESNFVADQTEPVKSNESKEHESNFKKFLPLIVGALFLIVIFYFAFDNTSSDNKINNSQNIARSVVNILCTSNGGEDSGGSGTIITEDGLILTNAHIIPQINEIPNISDEGCLIILPDELTGQPKEIYYGTPEITKGLSKDYDIAILQITSVFIDEDGKSWGTLPNTFPIFQDGSNCEGEYIKLGDSVRIYGYPVTSGGYNLTITDGIVSSFNDDGTILTSAKIDSGNSGGLAIDQDNCFIGIPSAIIEGNYQNLGVIIPLNLIDDFINEVPAQTNTEYQEKITDDANPYYGLQDNGGSNKFIGTLAKPTPLYDCPSLDCEIIRYYAETAVMKIVGLDTSGQWYEVKPHDDYGNELDGWIQYNRFTEDFRNDFN